MNDLEYDINRICKDHRHGSRGTQGDRKGILKSAARDLYALGYTPIKAKNLRAKHVEALLAHWTARELSIGSIKNRMSCLRWLLRRVNRQSEMRKSNDDYGIGRRQYVTNIDKSITLDERLQKISCPRVRLSLRAQQLFGLRKCEAIKLNVRYAEQGDQLVLKPSWTKGGVPRSVPIRTPEQRKLLRDIRLEVGNQSLIPPSKNYVRQKWVYEGQVMRAGMCKTHGLRHHYAQERYRELMGQEPPATGGPRRRDLGGDERRRDEEVRRQIAQELGHQRINIVGVYCGS